MQLKFYENLGEYNPSNEKSFLKAHQNLMEGLIENNGKYRNQSVGIVKDSKVEHFAPPFENVPFLMKDLFLYLQNSDEIELIKKLCFSLRNGIYTPIFRWKRKNGKIMANINFNCKNIQYLSIYHLKL